MTIRALRMFAIAAGLAAASAAASAQTIGYFGAAGPTFWSALSPQWAACGNGTMQSPVDFQAPFALDRRELSIDYGHTTGEILNNGHTVEVETEGRNTLTLGGVAYHLVQFHFHSASEHRVDGVGHDMELHLVHASADGANAVIGVFLKRGASSGPLAAIFHQLPNDLAVKHPIETAFDPKTFLPKSNAHFRYVGSLTTPPCSEGVQWIVMTEPVTISDEDMAQFDERVHFNARPVQRKVHGSED